MAQRREYRLPSCALRKAEVKLRGLWSAAPAAAAFKAAAAAAALQTQPGYRIPA
jgi:hypothetical protein